MAKVRKDFDLVVVGAGPGGSICAKVGAEKGLKVLLVERGETPGDKNASGCALSPKVFKDFSFMREMDIPKRVAKMATAHMIDENLIENSNISFSASRLGDYEEAREFLTINVYRGDLDPWLANLAIKAGAELKTSTLVKDLILEDGKICGVITENGKKIYSKIVIGADGAISIIAKKAGLRNKWRPDELVLLITYDFSADEKIIDDVIGDNAIHYWYSSAYPIGYSFFNKDGFHVGLGHYLSMFDKNPQVYLKRLLETDGIKRQIKLTNAKPREFQAHTLMFLKYFPNNVYNDGVMLVGDAAGFACPWEAEGVYYAMYSGKLAAEVAKESVDGNDFTKGKLKKYLTLCKNSPVGEEFEMADEIDILLKEVAFNPKSGWWVVPLISDFFFANFNVSEPHARTIDKYFERFPQIAYDILSNIPIKTQVAFLERYLKSQIKKSPINFLYKPIMDSTKDFRLKLIENILELIPKIMKGEKK